MGLQLAAPYPQDLTGTLTLTFTPDSFADDPTIQFASGGRTVNFKIPANTTTAVFGQSNQVQFSSGTVAGVITLTPILCCRWCGCYAEARHSENDPDYVERAGAAEPANRYADGNQLRTAYHGLRHIAIRERAPIEFHAERGLDAIDDLDSCELRFRFQLLVSDDGVPNGREPVHGLGDRQPRWQWKCRAVGVRFRK